MVNRGRLRQFQATIASGLGCLAIGVLAVWPSYTLELYSTNSTTPLSAPITKMEGSLLGSLPSLGGILGTAVAGTVLDKLGRKNGGIILSLPFVISWATIGITTSINVILAARFLAGVASGGSAIFSTVLVAEVAEDSIRGGLASTGIVLACIGVLFSYIMGWFLTYQTVIWTNVTISVTSIGLLMLIDETPMHLLRNGMEERAKFSLARYRGLPVSSKAVLDELHRLKQYILPEMKRNSILDSSIIEVVDEGEKEKLNNIDLQLVRKPQKNTLISSIKMLLFTSSSRRAFLVVTTMITIQVFMGMMVIQVYASTVFTEADPSKSELYTVIFAAVQFIGSLVSAVVTDKTGRRLLQIGSSALLALCLVGLGYLLQYKVAPSWVSVLLIMVYCFFFMIGPGSIPFILLSEVFDPQIIHLASMIIMEWLSLLNFFNIAVFPYIIDFLGIYGAFYGFGVMSLSNAVICYFILPETAGLSKEDIKKVFSPKRGK